MPLLKRGFREQRGITQTSFCNSNLRHCRHQNNHEERKKGRLLARKATKEQVSYFYIWSNKNFEQKQEGIVIDVVIIIVIVIN